MIGWPAEYPQAGTHFWASQVFSGMRSIGVRIEVRDVRQTPGNVMLLEVCSDEEMHVVALDNDDSPEIVEGIAEDVLLYFKSQYASDGYEYPNVVPGGYFLANNRAYRYLPLLRAIRSRQSFRYDVYGRFGLRYGGAEIRSRAFDLLSARTDFRPEVSLFKYPGGPEKVPYRSYLFEIPRAKVCVDMPGAGDLCTRLVDYLAVGACVVGAPPSVRLPVRLVDGVHIVYCAPDLSDLGDICAELVRDDVERERIARNGRDFFDRHLHRRQLAAYHMTQVIHASATNASRSRPLSRRIPAASERIALDEALALTCDLGRGAGMRRPAHVFSRIAAAAILLVFLFVALPEMLGDRPYDPKPSTWSPLGH